MASTSDDSLQTDLARLRSLDGLKWNKFGPEVLPAWVADMDLPPCPAAVEAMRSYLDRGDLGYNYAIRDEVPVAYSEWQANQHAWRPDPARIRQFNTVLHGIELVLWEATKPGDGVLLLMPIYPPFMAAATNTGRQIVECSLDEDTWSFNYEDLQSSVDEAAARGIATTTILLSSPHNPTGRVFSREELEALARFAEDNDLLVLSDEVWADLTHGATHIPFATISEAAAQRTVTFSSTSKAFNLAGTRVGIAHFGSERALAAVDTLPTRLLGNTNVLDAAASISCWRTGNDWLVGTRASLLARRDQLASRLAAEAPAIGFHVPEATYLAWLDCRELAIDGNPANFFESTAKVAFNDGDGFGSPGRGFVRLNFATTPAVLDEIVNRFVSAI